MRSTRRFFETEGFSEVETSALQVSPGNEVHLYAFETRYTDILTGDEKTYFLHTSPEFSMKKLLVAGMTKIFQLSHVFRNGERSSRHHPEFSMLEWYRTGASLNDIRADCVSLTREALKACGRDTFRLLDKVCDPFRAWENLSVPEAFQKFVDIELMDMIEDVDLFRASLRKRNIRASDTDSWDDLFFRVMGEHIEPFLGKDRPTFLCDYPVSMAALARPKKDDPRLADRFELYICGYEIANAFDELTDPDEQSRRFRADMDAKEALYGYRYPIDNDFLDALRHGMPASSGIALGFDRLVMLCAGSDTIDDVLWVPVEPR